MTKDFSSWADKLPMPRTQAELQSQVIDWLRFPLTFFVLVVHVNPQLSPFATPIPDIDFMHLTLCDFYTLLGRTGTLIGLMTVPFFFFVSGYFFFYKTETWNRTVYRTKIAKRVRSLLVPYLTWNLLCLLLTISHDAFKYFTQGQPQELLEAFMNQYGSFGKIVSYFWTSSIWDIGSTYLLGSRTWMSGPIILPFWFLRDLIVISLLSPLVYRAIKWGSCYLIGLLGVAYILKLWTTPGLGVTGIFFFTFGAWLSLNRKNIVETFHPFRKLIGGLTFIFLIACLTVEHKHITPILNNLFCLTGMISAINLAARLLEKGKIAVRPRLSQTCFFVYALHGMRIARFSFLGMGMTVAGSLFCARQGIVGTLLAYLASPVLGLIFCLLLFGLMKRFTPGFLKILIGGRL